MSTYHNIHDGLALQSLADADFLEGFLDPLTCDDALIGADTTWLDVGGGADMKRGIDLFPDLLALKDEDVSSWWMEGTDVKQFLTQMDGEIMTSSLDTDHDSLPTTVAQDDILSSDFLTPPDSPDAQVAPEIYFDQQDMDTIMATPLSPVDISLVLDAPMSELIHSVTDNDPPINTELTAALDPQFQDIIPLGMGTIEHDHLINLTIQDIESFVASTANIQSAYKNVSEMPTQTCFDLDVSSPSSTDELGDPDYVPVSYAPREKSSKNKATRPHCKKSVPKSSATTESSSSGDKLNFDVFSIKLNKKERKKMQNKNAATRYREKKREEKCGLRTGEDDLQNRNKELKNKVEQLTREIGYMKDLMAEVNKARGKTQLASHLLADTSCLAC